MQQRFVKPGPSLLLLAGLFGCGEPSVDRPDVGIFATDAGTPAPDPPRVTAIPERQPYAVATIRGQARARRVLVEPEGGNTVSTTVLGTDGSFCLDYPLPRPGRYRFVAFALDEQLSAPSAPFEVVYDPTAAPIPGAQTCTGADPAGCGIIELCGNGKDDDCDQRIDLADPSCQACQDDRLEPNDTLGGATRILAERQEPLQICPDNDDWYLVAARAGETFTVRALFTHVEGNLDLTLYALDGRTVLARGTGLSDLEQVTHTATAAGEYAVRIYGEGGTANRYALELEFSP